MSLFCILCVEIPTLNIGAAAFDQMLVVCVDHARLSSGSEFDFADAELGDVLSSDTKLIPSRVNDKRTYYAYFLAVMRERMQTQADLCSRAPTREHFITSLRLITELMDQGKNILEARNATPESASGSASAVGLS